MTFAYPPLPRRPRGGFRVLYGDPCWRYATRGRQPVKGSRLPDRHYKTLTTDQICSLPIGELMADDAWFFCWTTWPHLEHALRVIKAYGFKYSSVGFTWVKLKKNHRGELITRRSIHMTTGYTTRKNTEPCLLGRRGSPTRLSASVREAIFAPIREHSRKPDEAADRIVEFAPGPRLEIFAREQRKGFTAWGDQVGRFAA